MFKEEKKSSENMQTMEDGQVEFKETFRRKEEI